MSSIAIRIATRADMNGIASVMRASLQSFGSAVYNEKQIASALLFVARPDEQLIDDGTYFVAVADHAIVGCGGWSRRRKVYSGSAASDGDDTPLDPATEPARIRAMFVLPAWAGRGIGRNILGQSEQRAAEDGFRRFQLVALRSSGGIYEASGYRSVAEAPVTLEDGVVLECTLMEKAL